MRPVDARRQWAFTRRNRRPYDDRKQWLQLGMLSASVVAPLIARWNELRGAERAGRLLGEIEARLRTAGTLAPSTYRDMRQQIAEVARETGGRIMSAGGKRSSRLWLAGAGLGLVAASAGTYLLVRRRLRAAAEEPLLDLPIAPMYGMSANGGATTATPTRPLSEQPGEDLLQDDLLQQEPGEPMIVAPTPWDGGGATGVLASAAAGVLAPSEAPFIGDIKSMIYYESNAENLPAEQSRIYFASEEDAREAGYQRPRDEVPRV